MLSQTIWSRSRSIGLAILTMVATTVLFIYAAGSDAAVFSFVQTNRVSVADSSSVLVNEKSERDMSVTTCAPAPTGMVGWWPANGNPADVAGGNHGTLVNGAAFAAGQVGQAFSLGGGSYVDLPNSASNLLNNSSGTIAAWIYPTAVGDNDIVAAFGSGADGQGVGIGVWNNVRIYHHTGAYDWQSNTPVSANAWTFIVYTWDSTTERIYKDGVFSESRPRNFNYVSGAARIGHGFWGDSANLFPGLIDEVAVFNRTLSEAEILAIFNAGSSGICSSCTPPPNGIVSWWRGENNSADVFGLNDGTLRNGASFATGRVGRGFKFSGSAQHVEIPDSPSLRPVDGLTLEGWFRFDTASPQAALISKPFLAGSSNAYVVWMQGGALNAGIIGGVLSYPFNPTVGRWYHIAYTYDEATTLHRLYVDGNVVASTVLNSDPTYDGASLLIGMDKDGNTPVLELVGMADEIGISGRAMTPAEIQSTFNAGSSGICGLVCAPPPPGLAQWWPGEGDANDIQGPTWENGVPVNGTGFGPGKIGRAFSFDGSDDRVDFPGSVGDFGTAPFSLSFWVYSNNAGNGTYLAGKSHPDAGIGWDIRLHEEKIRLSGTNGWPTNFNWESDQSITPNTWHHVVVAAGASQLAVYINGVLKGTPTRSGISSAPNPFRLGMTTNFGGNPLSGLLDEVAIFNRQLAENEILELYRAGGSGLCRSCTAPSVGTAGWWKAEDNADDSLGTNNGALANGATFTVGKVGTAFGLDGADDVIQVPDAPDLNFAPNAPLTIHMWAYTTGSGSMHLIGKRGNCSDSGQSANYQIAQDSTNGLHFNSGGVIAGSGIQLETNRWYHVAATSDGTMFRLYLDGQEIAAVAGTLGAPNNGAPVVIGGACSGVGATFPGRLDEVTIVNRVLGPSEISLIQGAGSAGICSPTAGCAVAPNETASWWRAEDNALDHRKRNHATRENGASFAGGLVGRAFALDGIDDFVSVPAFDMGSSWTIEGWMDPTVCSDGIHCPLLSRSANNFDGLLVSYLDSGHPNQREFSVVIGNGSVWQVQLLSGTRYPMNTWHHVAATRNGDVYALYVNGVKKAEQTVLDVSPQYQSRAVTIGKWSYPAEVFTGGKIDEVSVVKRALSPVEVSELHAVAVTRSGKCAAPNTNTDLDGDMLTDLTIYRPVGGSGSEWWTLRSSTGGNWAATFGAPTDKLVAEDFTGDGKTDVAIYRPSNNSWYILRSEDYSYYSFPFGTDGDIPVPADYDGDGIADPAVYRPSSGTWYIARSTGGLGQERFGFPTDKPVPADYDGDGRIDIAIYRPSNGQWWLNRTNEGLIVHTFGNASDYNVPGDFTGDGKADIAIFRPSDNNWYVLRSEDYSYYSFPFGAAGDIPAAGDFDGDAVFDAAVFRPSDGRWYLRRSTAGVTIIPFGAAGDIPIPGVFIR